MKGLSSEAKDSPPERSYLSALMIMPTFSTGKH